jgi:hypothetical protein
MLGKRNESRTTWLKLFDGSIVQEWSNAPEGVEDIKTRVNKAKKTVYYVTYDFLEAEILDAELQSSEFGESILLTLIDAESTYRLTIQAASRYGNSFFARMHNIDLNKPVRFYPYSFVAEDGKQRTGISLSQEGTKLDWCFPKGTVPELIEKVRAGKTTYDDTDRYNFYIAEYEKFVGKVKSRIPAGKVSEALMYPPDFEEAAMDDDEGGIDLPF